MSRIAVHPGCTAGIFITHNRQDSICPSSHAEAIAETLGRRQQALGLPVEDVDWLEIKGGKKKKKVHSYFDQTFFRTEVIEKLLVPPDFSVINAELPSEFQHHLRQHVLDHSKARAAAAAAEQMQKLQEEQQRQSKVAAAAAAAEEFKHRLLERERVEKAGAAASAAEQQSQHQLGQVGRPVAAAEGQRRDVVDMDALGRWPGQRKPNEGLLQQSTGLLFRNGVVSGGAIRLSPPRERNPLFRTSGSVSLAEVIAWWAGKVDALRISCCSRAYQAAMCTALKSKPDDTPHYTRTVRSRSRRSADVGCRANGRRRSHSRRSQRSKGNQRSRRVRSKSQRSRSRKPNGRNHGKSPKRGRRSRSRSKISKRSKRSKRSISRNGFAVPVCTVVIDD